MKAFFLVLMLASTAYAREIRYIGEINSEELICVDVDYRARLNTFRVFVGSLGNLIERKVTGVRTLRDGGTTMIRFEENTLYLPAPSKREADTLNGEEIIPLKKSKIPQDKTCQDL